MNPTRTFIFLLSLNLTFLLQAQNTRELPAIIEEDYQLEAGSYEVTGRLTVRPEATLTVAEGVDLVFGNNAVIEIYGGLVLQGSDNQRISLRSEDPQNPGFGLIIKGARADKPVVIENADFRTLSSPVLFRSYWSRSEVQFNGNTIFNCEAPRAVYEMQPLDPLAPDVAVFFTNNTVANNTGGVFFTEFATQKIKTQIHHNVITGNHIYVDKPSEFYTAPLYLHYDEFGVETDSALLGNAIYGNYTVDSRSAITKSPANSIWVVGSGEEVDLGGNYFGPSEENELESSNLRVIQDYEMPMLKTDDILSESPQELNLHVASISMNDKPLAMDPQWAPIGQINTLSLKFNKAIPENAKPKLLYFYQKDDSLKRKPVDFTTEKLANGTNLKFQIKNPENYSVEDGYFYFEPIQTAEGVPSPPLYLGKKAFSQAKEYQYSVRNNFDELQSPVELTLAPAIVRAWEEQRAESEREITNRWEFGVFAGIPIYYGDLFPTEELVFDPKMINQKYAVGLRARYYLNHRFSLEASFDALQIEGADDRSTLVGSVRGSGRERNLAFRTKIYSLAALANYNFTEKRKINDFGFGAHAGISVFYFQPQGEYQGEWYDLRDIGTGGQTVNGNDNRYSPVTVGVPMGLHIERYFSRTFRLRLSFTFVYTFTDYLDDVSTDRYPDTQALRAANPDNPDAAVALSNPAGLNGLRTSGGGFDAYAFWGFTGYFDLEQIFGNN